MVGVAFLSLGLVSTVIGIFLLLYPRSSQVNGVVNNSLPKQEIKLVESKPVKVVEDSFSQKQIKIKPAQLSRGNNVEDKTSGDFKREAERKGVEFEKFVVKKFNKNYFSLTEWTSDKYVDGIYAENTLGPDLVFQFSLRDISEELAVECKWRKTLASKYEIVSAQQIENYRNFEQKRNIPVFLILGVGGVPSSPESLYIIPLNEIQSTEFNEGLLKEFKQDVNSFVFYDYKVKSLTANWVTKPKEQS